MAKLKKFKASTIIETIIASMVIVIVFTISVYFISDVLTSEAIGEKAGLTGLFPEINQCRDSLTFQEVSEKLEMKFFYQKYPYKPGRIKCSMVEPGGKTHTVYLKFIK